VAAAEHSRAHRKTGRSAGRTGALLAGVMLATGAHAGPGVDALPTGGHVSAGAAQISTSGNTLTVKEDSQSAAINWQTFSVGSSAQVNFVQPNAAAVILNRVVGNETSVINGTLHANGQVFLLDPNGVLIGRSGRIDTAGFVASTLDLSDDQFLAGQRRFTAGGKRGAVINLGTIRATDGGYVALLASRVENDGLIEARLGTAILAAGDRVSLNFNGNSLVGVTVDRATLNALVENRNAILADGGTVILTARGLDTVLANVVNNTGEIRAQTVGSQSGHIMLFGAGGGLDIGGTLDASAPAGGNGGAIETSAPRVTIENSTRITTSAPSGTDGTWLIDPTDFNIDRGSDPSTGSSIGATTLEAALAAGNVTILTQAAGTQTGNINVNAPVSWSGNKLTLEAYGDINVDAVMTASGTSTLDLRTGYNFSTSAPTYNAANLVRMGYNPNGTFAGRIDFTSATDPTGFRAGTGILSINGVDYTLINSLGVQGSRNGTDLQGMAGALSGSFALAGNIDASAAATWTDPSGNIVGFTAIGSTTGQGGPRCCRYTTYGDAAFTGALNGLGHTIDRLTTANGGGYDNYYGNPTGLFAILSNATVSNIGLTNASIQSYGDNASDTGALAGRSTGSTIANVYVTGTVRSSGNNNTGGLIGLVGTVNPFGVAPDNISRSYVAATVQGGINGGGFIGYSNVEAASITDSYFSGSVSGQNVGGMLGTMSTDASFTPTISTSYVIGSVTGATANVGAFIGLLQSGSLTVTNSFWNRQTTGLTSSPYGSSQTTAQLGTLGTFTGAAWQIQGSATQPPGYAMLGSGVNGAVWSVYAPPTPITISLSNLSSVFGTVPPSIAGGNWTVTGCSGCIASLSWGNAIAASTPGGSYGYALTPNLVSLDFGAANPANYIVTIAPGALTVLPRVLTYALSTSAPTTLTADGKPLYTPTTLAGSVENTWSNAVAASAPGPVTYTIWQNGHSVSSITGPGTYQIQVQLATSPDPDYTIATTGNALLTLVVKPGTSAAPESTILPLIADADRTAVVTMAAVSVAQPASTAPNVVNPTPQMIAAFGQGSSLTIVTNPGADEIAPSVTLSQARELMTPSAGDGGGDGAITRDVRVPASRNSLAEVVNGGVRLPGGVDQMLFLVQEKK